MKALNLFGDMQEIPQEKDKHKSIYQIRKAVNKYGPAKNKVECCKNCVSCVKIEGNTKNYYKCKRIGISHGEATDIRLKDTCNKFKLDENQSK